MKSDGSRNVTDVKFKNRSRTQSRTRSPIWRSLMFLFLEQIASSCAAHAARIFADEHEEIASEIPKFIFSY